MRGTSVAETQSSWDDFFVFNPASRHRRRRIKSIVREACAPFEKVLDIGCGDGRLLEELQAEFRCGIYGMEPHVSSATQRLKGILNGFYACDIEDAVVKDTFDLIIMSEVLEHTKDDAKAMANVAKMSSGHLLITVPAGPIRKTDVTMGHERHYTVDSLRTLAERNGYKTLACYVWGFPFHSLYRGLLNLAHDRVIHEFGQTRYGPAQKLVSRLLYGLFFLNSSRRGCQLFYLGERLQS